VRLAHPTDFSASSQRALILAESLQRRTAGHLTVCHVLEASKELPLGYLSMPVGRTVVPTSQEVDFHYRIQAQARNERAARRQGVLTRLASIAPAGARTDLLLGDLGEQLENVANEHDLAIIGWGEASGRLIRRSGTPVLCAPVTATATAVGRVLLATDFGPAAERALDWCRGLTVHGVEVVLAHVAEPGREDGAARTLAELAEQTGFRH
jgi:hypothetical protein